MWHRQRLPKIEVKDLKISGGLGFYANFVDPDLVGKAGEKRASTKRPRRSR